MTDAKGSPSGEGWPITWLSVECSGMLLVGLTGGIGSGKSTVAEMLRQRGAVVIDADEVSHEVVEPGRPAYDEIVARFGGEIVLPDGRIDRPGLAEAVFGDDGARMDLNAIVHPRVGAEMMQRIAGAGEDTVVVCDVPLLAEAQARAYPMVIVVEASRERRLDRLEGRGVDRRDAEARMAVQATDEERRALADVIIHNDGSIEQLEPQVDELWTELQRRKAAAGP